jgi:amidase
VESGIEAVCRRASESLAQCGASVAVIELDLSAGRDAFLALRGLWFVSWMYERLGRLEEFGVNVKNNTNAGLSGAVRDLGAAETVRGQLWHRFRAFFETYDHLLTPTMAVPPFPVEQNYPDTVAGKVMKTYVDWIAPTFVLSLTGLPVASVPCGLDGEGLPVGLQIVGRPQGEEAVLALAKVVQELNPVGAPPLDARA